MNKYLISTFEHWIVSECTNEFYDYDKFLMSTNVDGFISCLEWVYVLWKKNEPFNLENIHSIP